MPVIQPARAIPPLSTVEDVGEGRSILSSQCRQACGFDGATRWHHRRLMAIETDQDVLLELIELAVTWPELEYSETPTIAPDQWIPFVENHRWADPDRVERIFSVATDIAMATARASRRPPRDPDCPLGWVDDAAPDAVPTVPMARPARADLGSVANNLDGPALTRLVADHCDSSSGYGDELAEGWPGRTLARRHR